MEKSSSNIYDEQGLLVVLATRFESPQHGESIDYSVDIVSLSKMFNRHTMAKGAYTTFKTSLVNFFLRRDERPHNVTHAIKDLTLRIPCGASVGIIGRNGSGKSTLLKLITGIYKPTTGKVDLRGRVAALIELGAGFHPDFTGRENLMLGAVMHGLTRSEVRRKFDDIVQFAELEEVIDDPVRTYSSGMFMRLGFSLAIHTDPDVLIIDEVLAVGDAAFVSKCKEKIAELRKRGKTLLLVTHDLDAVERWCDEVLWLHAGEVRDRGEPRRVIDHYREFIERGEEEELREEAASTAMRPENTAPAAAHEEPESARWGSREAEIGSIRLLGRAGQPHQLFHTEDPFCVEFDYLVREGLSDLVFGIGIRRSDGVQIFGTNTDIERVKFKAAAHGVVRFAVERLGLLEGSYFLDVAVHRSDGYAYDYHKGALRFAVRSPFKQIGVFDPKHRWEVV
ncbi:MAG: ABC transporter ATP-binding protein [Deltaproteobacteria bacterium]|nr:ABC transporter ATP-binding protein [Deltaproteobacteria bacterium]